MHIETQNLVIREFIPADADALAEMAADGTLNDIFGECEEYSWMGGWIEETGELCREDNPWKEYLAYAIERKADGRLVGSVGCSVYDDLHKIGITYFIGSDFRGSGYAAEAVRAYTRNFFQKYDNVCELIATIQTENLASRRTVERAGYHLDTIKMYQDVNDNEEKEYYFYSYD